MFDALLLLLRRSLILFEQVEVVSVSTEDSLIIHDVEGVTLVILIAIQAVGVRFTELILPLHDSGLGTVKCLGHFQK